MTRHDASIGSLLGILAGLLGCHPHTRTTHRDLPTRFPDMQSALGSFAIHLEKSRETHKLSTARIKLEQGATHKHVTLQLRMLHGQEQVALSFVPQNQLPLDADVSGCMPSMAVVTDSEAPWHPTPMGEDAIGLLHMPLPRSIQGASAVTVDGAGASWTISDRDLVWHRDPDASPSITLNWVHGSVPEVQYPLQTQGRPIHLKARRLDAEGEHDIHVTWHDGFVWIQEQDAKPEAWLELQYDVPGTDPAFLLPQKPIFDGLKTRVMLQGCDREHFILEEKHLTWTCPTDAGPLWAASYTFDQATAPRDLSDWPELKDQAPQTLRALGETGEPLEVVTSGPHWVVRHVPEETSRICIQALWTSDPPR